jgi:SagB-type dehydrogenase family enzyme
MDLPRHILDRVERLYAYHQRTKISAMGRRPEPPDDPSYKPTTYRVFLNSPKVALPASLLDAPVGMLSLLAAGQDNLPESLRAPPQDLRTLASWLYYAVGETRHGAGRHASWTRPFPDAEADLPLEFYVAVFSLRDVEPGLYHFAPREYALRRLRDGPDPLLLMKKGRPDLEFLKTVPAAVLVSANYWKAVYRHGRRGYRSLLLDGGAAIQNLTAAGAGLGIQTVTRLRTHEAHMAELIGSPPDESLATAESVLALVAWADPADDPPELPTHPPDAPATGPMPAIVRPELSVKVYEDPAALEPLFVHHDCVAPGVAVREIRPPLTELSPLPAHFPVTAARLPHDPEGGLAGRAVLLDRRPTPALARHPVPRDQLMAINRLAFRGGSFSPMSPDGPHVATVRPFWIVHDVPGFDPGIWYYHPPADTWGMLRPAKGANREGRFRREGRYVAGDANPFGDGAAACVMVANLPALMTHAGPDAYRLAHLEAGIVTQRLYLAATAYGLAAVTTNTFYDDECRHFLGLSKTGWEPLSLVAIGHRTAAASSQFTGRP